MDCLAVHRSVTVMAISSTPSICLLPERGTLALHRLWSPRYQIRALQLLRRSGLFVGDLGCLNFTGFVNKEAHRCRLMEARAASKPSKPPPKSANRTTIAMAVALPLLFAGAAVITGKLLVRRMHLEALEDAEEWERRANASRLLADGKGNEPFSSGKGSDSMESSATTVGTRNRPKRTE